MAGRGWVSGYKAWLVVVLWAGGSVALGVSVVLGPIITIGVACAIAAGTVVLLRPVAGIYALLVIVPFNDLVSQFLHGRYATAFGALKDGILALLVLAAFLRARAWIPMVRNVFLVLAVSSVIGAVITSQWTPALYGFRNEVEPLLLLFVIPALCPARLVRRALIIFLLVGEAAAVISIATWRLGLPWLFRLSILPVTSSQNFPTSFFTAGNDRPRAFSPLGSPNDLATAMAVVVAASLFIPRLRPSLRIALCALPFAATLLSRSRSGMLGIAAVLVLWVMVRFEFRRRLFSPEVFIFAFTISTAAVGILFASKSVIAANPSTTGHLQSLFNGVGLLVSHPLGLGLGTSGPRAVRYFAKPHLVESSFLLMGFEVGWAGLLAYVYLTVAVLHRLARRYRSLAGRQESQHLVLAGIAAIIGSAIPQLVLPVVQDATLMFLVWIVVGLAMATVIAPGGSESFDGVLMATGHIPQPETTGAPAPSS